jgi:hypothetical protein
MVFSCQGFIFFPYELTVRKTKGPGEGKLESYFRTKQTDRELFVFL